jgi:DNA-binding winged helix-turn-helix (wHTH) protein/Tol biopolymer transport system component
LARPTATPRIVRFGVFEVNLDKAGLRKHGLRVRIQEQPYQILSALLERPGEVITREELVCRIWPDGTSVEYHRSLNAAVTRLRQTLSDSAENPRYIATVARRGYRFVMPVESLTETTGAVQLEVPVDAPPVPAIPLPRPEDAPRSNPNKIRIALYCASFALLTAVVVALTLPRGSLPGPGPRYMQITDFTDSAIAPTLSPDGRTVAFIRSADWFLSRGQIWLKSLPDGEPVQLTYDPRPKFAPAFSPDGSRVAYSVVEPSTTAWDTMTVPVLGGEPRLLLGNAEGLTWLSKDRVLFSEIKKGIHMAVVTAKGNRSQARDIYIPEHERAMAHFAYAAPDRKWVLVIEMDHTTEWQPCRVVPFDGTSRGWQVGPNGRCTAVGWSPDGRWMYFTVATSEGQHLWRQRFPRGDPEQVTFGPAEAQGVAVAPDGRTLVTSLGMQQSAIWLHDSDGERQISSVGSASLPIFSKDGSRVFYLLRRNPPDSDNELWTADLGTGQSERLVSGFDITSYDVADNQAEAVLGVKPAQGKSQIWLVSLERRASPVRIASNGEDAPYFGSDGQILMRVSDGQANYLFRMNRDGSGRVKLRPDPVFNVMSISSDRLWFAALAPVKDAQSRFAEVAIPIQGGSTKRICSGFCIARWAPDGRYLYVSEHGSASHPTKTVAIPVPPGKTLPELPSSGIRALSGGAVIEHSTIAPGPTPSTYAYVKTTMHRNLFRIPIP